MRLSLNDLVLKLIPRINRFSALAERGQQQQSRRSAAEFSVLAETNSALAETNSKYSDKAYSTHCIAQIGYPIAK